MSTTAGHHFDYLVIGGGSGGIASARRAATYGVKAAVIEGSKLGGTCVNVGCVPKKVMWHAANAGEAAHDAVGFGWTGIDAPAMQFDMAGMRKRRDAYVARLNGIYGKNLEGSGVELLQGWGELRSANSVAIKGPSGDESLVTADNILLATGGKPWMPTNVPGAELGITSDGFWELENVPQRAVVVGGGYIGTELAGILSGFGSKVTMALRGECLLNGFDPMIRANTRSIMEASGVDVQCGVNVSKVEGEAGNLTVHLDSGAVLEGVDCLLWATGRVPNTQGLNLAAAGIEAQPNGKIAVDAYQATSCPSVFALGDIVDTAALTPVAIAAGRLLADRLFGGFAGAKLDYDRIPTVVFAHPPIGTIGLTEPQAADKYGKDGYQVYTSSFNALYYGVLEHKVGTVMKMITAGDNDEIVGLHVQGQGADEMLQGFGVALRMGATKADFDSCVAIHPTSAEEFVTMPPWAPRSQI